MSRELSTLITAGKRAFQGNDLNQAELILKEAIENGASYPDIHYTLGLIYHKWERYEEAVDHFRQAVAINPGYTEALLSLSIALNDMGRYEEAKAAYAKATASLSAPPDPLQGNMFRGRIANLHSELGQIYLALGQYDDASAEFRKAITVAPDFPDLRVRLAVALRESGRIAEAIREIRPVVEKFPKLVSAQTQYGVLLYLSGEKDGAREAWEKALYADPLNKLVQFYLNSLGRDAK